MLRAPFSLEKIHWNEKTKQVIYRSKRSWHTKQNYQIFTAADFIATTVDHIPPKSQQTIHYYGRYSNKRRGWDAKNRIHSPQLTTITLRPQTRPTILRPNLIYSCRTDTQKETYRETRLEITH